MQNRMLSMKTLMADTAKAPAARGVSKGRVLVVDDEERIRWTLEQTLLDAGYDVSTAGTGSAGLAACERGVDLVLLDYRLPDTDGIAVLEKIKAIDPEIVVLIMTAYSTIERAVTAMKLGAFHYLIKPFDPDELLILSEQALETTRLRRELRSFRENAAKPYSFEHMIGGTPPIIAVRELMKKIASSPASTVLVTGESGTGKDLAARIIHFNSARAPGLFMNVTCSALPAALLESELFGHERGAFTDAKAQRKGLLERADGGTVFLDEIGELELGMQAKLLRFLEDKAFKRVGGSTDIAVDVRVIAATNRDLKEEVGRGRFREDLFYRLNVLPIALPPLRARVEDIALLARYYVDRFNEEFRKAVPGVSRRAQELLDSYGWPGNVRELRNMIERATLLTEGGSLQPRDFLDFSSRPVGGSTFELPSGGVELEELERDLVVQALRRTGGNQTRAAKLLGLNRDQIRYRVVKFELDIPSLVKP